MAKSINWPEDFREEILAEDDKQERIALRLGELYYENRYWVPEEVVDIRANQEKVRQGVIIGDLRRCCVGELTDADLNRQKRNLQSREAIMRFLAQTYGQPVDEETMVTIVTYRNLPVEKNQMEEP